MQNLTSAKVTLKTQLKNLAHPAVSRLAKKHPDAEWSVWNNHVEGQIDLWVDPQDLEDISALPGVECTESSYLFRQRLTTRTPNGGPYITLDLRVRQPYTDEEKDLLRAVGKLQTIPYEGSYATLVCVK